jgi:glutamate N-acetyltransferase/amino-acid N-acetyltransferase
VAAAGIKHKERDDLVAVELGPGSTCAGVLTRNAFCAAPVTLAREHLAAGGVRYLLINSGNANAGTGAAGLRDARETCRALAAAAGCSPQQVLPFSTGVIGEPLPADRIVSALPRLLGGMDEGNWPAAARAIMTTDTVPKLVSRRFELEGEPVTVTGMAKGSGMICPDMATMLAYLATDARVGREALQACLERAVAPSFNAITVDGDTSTNDACMLIASGRGTAPPVVGDAGAAFELLTEAVTEVCMELARRIVRDGEGATKLVKIAVEEAESTEEARRVAYTIAHSPLVKTALFASDPNWGRILAAVGRAGVRGLDIERVSIWLGAACIVRAGARAEDYTEAAGQAVMREAEIPIRVALGRGGASARILTCDLSYEYVRINAEYRT